MELCSSSEWGRTKECYVWAAVLGKGRILLLCKSILLFLARAGSLSKISLFLLIIGLKGFSIV
jgi:hypothetical protein